MSSTSNPAACAAFQDKLPELIASGANLSQDQHLSNCALCQALLADLESIAEAARQLLAPVEPPDKLWSQIESAILHDEESVNE
jgi:hypothetical protein